MNELLLALALMMVVEGVMPLVSPRRWRDVFSRLLAMSDGQIRFIGLASMVMGVLAILFLLR